MLVLTRTQVAALLDPDALVDALAVASAELSAGGALVPQRLTLSVPAGQSGGNVYVMPAYLPAGERRPEGSPQASEPHGGTRQPLAGALVNKLVGVFPGNQELGLTTHPSVVVALDPATGIPAAVLDGSELTVARTAAGSALATRLLARTGARVLAILGTGAQARAHALAVARVRQFDEIRIAGRDPARTTALATDLDALLKPPVRPAASWAAALDGADVVCATTHSPDPVVRREWLAEGTHVNSVGLNAAGGEIDARTVADALVVVESRSAALATPPAGARDLIQPIQEGLVGVDHLAAEVGELVAGTHPGRTGEAQLTLYKSVGVAAQDAAAAALVLRRAAERGVGASIDLLD